MLERLVDQNWQRLKNDNNELTGFTRSVKNLIPHFDTTIIIQPQLGIYECEDTSKKLGITRKVYRKEYEDNYFLSHKLIDYQQHGYSRDIDIQVTKHSTEAAITVDLEGGVFDWPIKANYDDVGALREVTILHESTDEDEMEISFETDPGSKYVYYRVEHDCEDVSESLTLGSALRGEEVVFWNKTFSVSEDVGGITTFSIRKAGLEYYQTPVDIGFPSTVELEELYCQVSSENAGEWQAALEQIPTIIS